MSLYSDLNEVLTPYAQRIKGLEAADKEIKAILGEVAEMELTQKYIAQAQTQKHEMAHEADNEG